jgi:hypothetical protein
VCKQRLSSSTTQLTACQCHHLHFLPPERGPPLHGMSLWSM